ncbi:MAG: hypothetical protein HZB34_02640 [Nitrospirae bacterium]|nr:hypothetical protein [Nitrospirota bacterium]
MKLRDLCRRACLFFYPRADPNQSPVALHTAVPAVINLAGFTKGIDNVHLDVQLSPQFQGHTETLLAALVEQETQDRRVGATRRGPTFQQWEEFRNLYTRMMEAATHQAKSKNEPSLVQLAQVATIKFLLEEVDRNLDHMRQKLRRALASDGLRSDTVRIEANEWLSWLIQNKAKLKYKILRQLLTPILQSEEGTLGELRQSLWGERWSLPREFISNPLLLADSPFDEELLMTHYVLLEEGGIQDGDRTYSYAAMDRLIPNLFPTPMSHHGTRTALAQPEQVLARTKAEFPKAAKKLELGQGSVGNEPTKSNFREVPRREDSPKTQFAWAEVPANVDLLFDDSLATNQIQAAKRSGDESARALWKAQRRFQRRMLATVERHFRRNGLLMQVVAAFEIVPIYKELSGLLAPGELHRFVVNQAARKGLLEKIDNKQGPRRPGEMAPLIQLSQHIAKLSHRKERDLLIKFVKAFLTFRRDLTHLQILRQAVAVIELRTNPNDLRLSRANLSLHRFLGTAEIQTSVQTVRNHVILKADIRGSTKVVAELCNRSLNPASHFSLNFFDPLNSVLQTYGANKVFIEGDAVILSMTEHKETPEHQFSAARMCGIGKRLLDLVQKQNTSCRKNGLPELEIGIGVVYCEGPPTFLFDGNQPIMISPAIGMADRLSSCSWMLRNEQTNQKRVATNVQIYDIPQGHSRTEDKFEGRLRYNVNGIELNKEGFVKLQSELTLQEVTLVLPRDDTPTTFFFGKYPDLNGALHRLIIRLGHIRSFDQRHPQLGIPMSEAFYEVIVDDTLRSQVEAAVNAHKPPLRYHQARIAL